MIYDFETPANRAGSNCYKWDVDKPEDGIIPMWVADMDFRVAPKITEALRKRVDHAVFGYTKVPQSFYDAIVNWYARRHDWKVDPDSIIYTIGVVPAVSSTIKAIAKGERCGVLLQTPAYNCFFSCLRNNDCDLVENKLVREGDSYVIDFEDFEAKAALPETKIFLLCNPQNPTGRVWTPEELRRMGDICRRHGVTVVSDEIHSGIVMPGYKYTPYASLGKEYAESCVVTSSCSKSFNIAGLQIAYIIAGNKELQKAIDRAININEVCDVNPFGVEALQVAFNECEDWLDELCLYVKGNHDYLTEFCAKELGLTVIKSEGSYLGWVDCRPLGMTSAEIGAKLLSEAKVRVSSGDIYGEPDGYIRVNLACPRAQLVEALERMKSVLKK